MFFNKEKLTSCRVLLCYKQGRNIFILISPQIVGEFSLKDLSDLFIDPESSPLNDLTLLRNQNDGFFHSFSDKSLKNIRAHIYEVFDFDTDIIDLPNGGTRTIRNHDYVKIKELRSSHNPWFYLLKTYFTLGSRNL